MNEVVHGFIKFISLIGLVVIPCAVIGLHIWDLKNTIKEHEKRIAELEKKLDSVQH